MSNTLQQTLEAKIDFYTKKILVNNVVKRIHKEWILKFKVNGGKVTKRETNELEKRLNALGFNSTFEKRDSCIHCEIFHDKVKIDWFGLYYNIQSLENTVTTIESQLTIYVTTVARLKIERQSAEDLSKIEPQANVLKAAIVYLLQEFKKQSQFDKLTTFSQDEMQTAKLLMETLYKLS